MRIHPIKLPSIKNFLIKLNNDLDKISQIVNSSYIDNLNYTHKYTIILEDIRYFKHYGVDVKSIIREIFKKLTFQKHGGFSTIEMQLVRTITGNYEIKISRKLYEMFLALLCNFHFNKIIMIETYLKIAYMGTDYQVNNEINAIGNHEKIAMDLYGNILTDLTKEQAAQIAAHLVYPRPSTPSTTWKNKITRRANYGLALMSKHEKMFEKINSA